jgi:hypothetical protein
MPVKPIKPSDVVAKKQASVPDFVLEVFNGLIAKNFDGSSARFTQDAAVAAILEATDGDPVPVTRARIFENHWLDVEPIYEKAGWKVEYDKPGYNETYAANWIFRKPK